MNNTRILIIDDEEIVRDSIREVLLPRKHDDNALMEAAFDLFDEGESVIVADPTRNRLAFQLDESNNGQAGLQKVTQAIEKGKPYAMIFLDMRMPGWDGLKTCVEIRKVDPKVQIFFVTAFTDHSIDEIISLAGGDVGYLSKPFSHEEILQIANKGIYDWHRLTNLEQLLDLISHIRIGDIQLNTLLVNILHQIADYVGTDCALLGKLNDSGTFEVVSRIGAVEDRFQLDRLGNWLPQQEMDKIKIVENVLVCPMEQYCILAVPANGILINQEKAYLLRIFVENAVRAIKNAKLNEQLLQKEKLSAVGQAIGMVMHDIKTPIAQIQSLTELIQMDAGDAENTLELSADILSAVEHASDIIHDVNDFVKNAQLVKVPIQLPLYLHEIVEELSRGTDSAGVEIALDTPPVLLGSGDPKKLKRVIINLINNAVEAMESKGIESPKVLIHARLIDGFIELVISDNGPGIPEKIRLQLFEPFVTSGKANGTGLGLAIVKQIIEAHGGQITVDAPKAGAQFTILLPQA